MRHRDMGMVGMSSEDWQRVERLRGTLLLYGFDAAASNAIEIYRGLRPRETDRLMEEFGSRMQLSKLLCEETAGGRRRANGSSSRGSPTSPFPSSPKRSAGPKGPFASKRGR